MVLLLVVGWGWVYRRSLKVDNHWTTLNVPRGCTLFWSAQRNAASGCVRFLEHSLRLDSEHAQSDGNASETNHIDRNDVLTTITN